MSEAPMRHYRRNPDERTRDFERRLAAGDASAIPGLISARLRSKEISHRLAEAAKFFSAPLTKPGSATGPYNWFPLDWEHNIHPSVYETGGGYSWQQIEGSQVAPHDVEIWPIPFEGIRERVWDYIHRENPGRNALVLVHPSSLDSYRSMVGYSFADGLADTLTRAAVTHEGPVWIVWDEGMAGSMADRFKDAVIGRNPDVRWIEFSDDATPGWGWIEFLKELTRGLKASKVKSVTVGGIWWDPQADSGCAYTVFKHLKKKLKGVNVEVDTDLTGSEEDAEDEESEEWEENPAGELEHYVKVSLSSRLWAKEDPRPWTVHVLDTGYNASRRAKLVGRYPNWKFANVAARRYGRDHGLRVEEYVG